MDLFEEILKARGLSGETRAAFLSPDYDKKHDPFLLPDMDLAVERLVKAREEQEHIAIYGDYDIDGLSATALLLDAFTSFGFQHVTPFIPNRFTEGYGLTIEAIEKLAADKATLIVTVDTGSLSHKEIARANELGVDVIVTDHHNVADDIPPAVATVNPKRWLQEYPELYEGFLAKHATSAVHISPAQVSARESRDMSRESRTAQPDRVRASEMATPDVAVGDPEARGASRALGGGDEASDLFRSEAEGQAPPGLYPFLDLAAVGVAFKLVQALQTRLEGLPEGQEKWLLDLVALGTVCDIVTLADENRTNVYWGLKVMAQTRRPGLKALMAVSGVTPDKLNARSLGFGLGPRMNASGRLETAQHTLDMLTAADGAVALEKAQLLDDMNRARRVEQDRIFEEAAKQAENYANDPVLVVSSQGWSHGIIGIVAAKLLEKYKKPTYVLEELGEESKGSARSFGDFSAADAIRAADDIITKGGGHTMAAGVTLPTKNIAAFRQRVNDFYKEKQLKNQQTLLLPKADVVADFGDVNETLIAQIATLEPFGNGNPQPILRSDNVLVVNQRRMGADAQHLKLTLQNAQGQTLSMLAFSAPEHFFVEPGDKVNVWYQPDINEWNGRRTVEGRLLHLESA